MTVRELLAILSELPLDLTVVREDRMDGDTIVRSADATTNHEGIAVVRVS